MRNLILSMTVLIFCLATAGAQDNPVFLSESDWTAQLQPADRTQLKETGEIFRELANGEDFRMFPGSESVPELESIKSSMKRYFGTETMLFLPFSGIPDSPEKREPFLLALYNLIRHVSTLQGMDYYSASRERRRTLFNEFYAISEHGSRTPLTDPIWSRIPPSEKFLIFQNDATFGDAEYEVTYKYENPVISLTLKNTTTLVYKIIPVAGKEKLYMYARIIPVRGSRARGPRRSSPTAPP